MANTLQPGADVVENLSGSNTHAQKEYFVKASQTITKGDLVLIASGFVDIATAGSRVFGIANSTVVGNSAGTSKILVTLVEPGTVFRMRFDQDTTTCTAAHEGTYFNLVGATGAMMVDSNTTSATTGQLFCIKFNPTGRNITTLVEGDFIAAETYFHAYAQV
jgi:hypothetical protein